MKKLRPVAAALIAALAWPSFASAVEVKIASWNMNWLTEGPNMNTSREDSDWMRLRRYGAALEADIIALQEVENEAAAFRVFGPSFMYYFSGKNSAGKQRTAILVKKKEGLTVTQSKAYYPLNVNGTLREAVDLIVSSPTQKLRILNVHLKSGCPDADLQTSEERDCITLNDQVQSLERWVKSRSKEASPFVMVGDFNRHLATEDMRRLTGDLLVRLDGATPESYGELAIANVGQPRCWNGRFRSFIDYILMDPRASRLYKPKSFAEQLYTEQDFDNEANLLSDHCPISATFALE